MTIPKQFQLMGRTIKVEYDKDLDDREDALGAARYRRNKIIIQDIKEKPEYDNSRSAETFCHELIHWLFYMSCSENLNNDEDLVIILGRLLHQAFETMEF